MEVVIAPADTLARLAADSIDGLLRANPRAVLGLATGSSPLKVYDELARRHQEEGLSFASSTLAIGVLVLEVLLAITVILWGYGYRLF